MNNVQSRNAKAANAKEKAKAKANLTLEISRAISTGNFNLAAKLNTELEALNTPVLTAKQAAAALKKAMAESGKSFLKVWNTEKDNLKAVVGVQALTKAQWEAVTPAELKAHEIVIKPLKSGGYTGAAVRAGLMALFVKSGFPTSFMEAAAAVFKIQAAKAAEKKAAIEAAKAAPAQIEAAPPHVAGACGVF